MEILQQTSTNDDAQEFSRPAGTYDVVVRGREGGIEAAMQMALDLFQEESVGARAARDSI